MGLEEKSFYTRTCIGAVFSPIAAVAILATDALVFVAGATLTSAGAVAALAFGATVAAATRCCFRGSELHRYS